MRVNNLANIESLLNICGNFGEIAFMLVGAVLLLNGMHARLVNAELDEDDDEGLTTDKRISLGAILLVAGFMLPGMINWFVASARDANLFS